MNFQKHGTGDRAFISDCQRYSICRITIGPREIWEAWYRPAQSHRYGAVAVPAKVIGGGLPDEAAARKSCEAHQRYNTDTPGASQNV